MALSSAQRNRLPKSAFVVTPAGKPRSSWKYPVPTKAQAAKAGISESQRQRLHSTALAYSGRPNTAGTKSTVRAVVNKRK
jgi:hypothetical protein